MQCPKCQTENPDDAGICRACGCALEDARGDKPLSKPKTSWLAGLSLVLAVATLFFFYLAGIPSIVLAIVSLFLISKSRGKLKGKPFAIAAIVISIFLMSAIYLWSLDAPPIPKDYTIADLRSAPPDCNRSYELLISLSDPPDCNSNDDLCVHRAPQKDSPDAPKIGLTTHDIDIIEQINQAFKEDDYAKITAVIEANEADLIQAWDNAATGRAVIYELNVFPEIADLTQPRLDVEIRFLRNMKLLVYLYQSYVCLQAHQGKSRGAAEELIRFDSVFRKLSLNARSILTKVVCMGSLTHNIMAANFIANHPQTPPESLQLLAKHFLPLTNNELSLRNAIISEYLIFRDVLDTELSKAGNRSTCAPKTNSTLRVARNHCIATLECAQEANKGEGRRDSVWPAIYPDFMPNVSITGELTPWQCWQYRYYNPIGSLLLSVLPSPLESIVDLRTNVKVQDDLFQIVLNKRLGKEVSLKARAYSDEYIIDVEAKKIFSPGPDGEPNTTDDIKLPINPQVLGF